MARYRQMSSSYIEKKKKSLQEPLETLQPIDVFFKIINDRLWYSSEATAPLLPTQVLQMAYHAVRYSGIYTYACKYWIRKPSADKTWDNFKIIFSLEYN